MFSPQLVFTASGTRTPGTTLASKEDPEKPLNNFSSFTVAITGQIESCDSLHDNLYCKYTFVFGSDWSVTSVSVTYY